MNSGKLGNALARSKDIAINLLGSVLYRTRVEPVRDEEGITGLKARWVGDQGENVIEINTPSGNADIKIDGDDAPTIEYIQEGEKRTVAVRHVKNLSCELSQETLDRIATPRGAATAICIGAGVGLFGWFVLSVARALSTQRVKQIDTAISPLISRDSDEPSENTTPENDENYSS